MTDYPEIDEDHLPRQPVRVFLYSDGLASIDGELQMSAFGSGALGAIARKLVALGYDGDQELDVHRGGECINRILLRDAAQEFLEDA
jgi:hypothetical protein